MCPQSDVWLSSVGCFSSCCSWYYCCYFCSDWSCGDYLTPDGGWNSGGWKNSRWFRWNPSTLAVHGSRSERSELWLADGRWSIHRRSCQRTCLHGCRTLTGFCQLSASVYICSLHDEMQIGRMITRRKWVGRGYLGRCTEIVNGQAGSESWVFGNLKE